MARRILVAALLLASAARADESFGHRGQVVPFGTLSYSHVSANDQSGDELSLGPGALWFFTDYVAVGGSVTYRYVSALGFTALHTFGVEPTLAVALPLADNVALFPRLGVEFAAAWSGGNSANAITLDGFAPLLFFPAPHFYLGIGPQLRIDVGGDTTRSTTVGFATEIGGWF
jgi:hypothetical protein